MTSYHRFPETTAFRVFPIINIHFLLNLEVVFPKGFFFVNDLAPPRKPPEVSSSLFAQGLFRAVAHWISPRRARFSQSCSRLRMDGYPAFPVFFTNRNVGENLGKLETGDENHCSVSAIQTLMQALEKMCFLKKMTCSAN